MMMYYGLGFSIVVNVILIIYLLYIYLFKGELRENKNVEYAEVNPEIPNPPVDDCAQCLSEHEDMIKQIDKLKEEITTLTSTYRDLNQSATTIRYGMDRLMQAATRSNITIN
jgi:hypothetical protein